MGSKRIVFKSVDALFPLMYTSGSLGPVAGDWGSFGPVGDWGSFGPVGDWGRLGLVEDWGSLGPVGDWAGNVR